MSLSSALSVALTGLQVNTVQLQVTANNISNAQSKGYTEKQANITSLALGGDAAGVQISGYTRATNTGLTNSFNAATGQASYYSTQNKYLTQIQTLLNSKGNPPALQDAVSQFQSAWTQFSAAPESAAQQQSLLQAANNLASQIRSASSAVLQLTRQVISDTSGTVNTLNSDLQQIAQLNSQIASVGQNSQSSGNLADQRDQLVNAVAGITNITVMPRPNGQIALYTPSGNVMLDGTPQTYTYNGSTIISSSGQDVTNILKGGSLEAQVQFLANSSPAAVSTTPGIETIRKINSQLSELANSLTDATAGSPATFANAYNNATTGAGELANNFFQVGTTGGVPDPTTLVVNPNLLNGTSAIKQASGPAVIASLSAARTFTADGLSVSGSYTDLVSGILSNFQQDANAISAQSTTATQQQGLYQQSLANDTGVNVDTELVNLTTLQNSYAASAHVISTINQMLQELTQAI